MSGALVTAEEPGTALLENMSSRPRTDITRVVPLVQQRWVLFHRWGHRSVDGPEVFDADVLERLDRRWGELGLTGATVVRRGRANTGRLMPLICEDEDLVLNVLLRVRGNLLIHRMPLLDRYDPDEGEAVLCPDPRLFAIVSAADEAREASPSASRSASRKRRSA